MPRSSRALWIVGGLWIMTGPAAGRADEEAGRAEDAEAGAGGAEVRPPVARVEPTELEAHGQVRVDEYYWMRNRESPDVLAYLEAENAYTEARMAPVAGLEQALFDEIVGRLVKDDSSVPVRHGSSWTYTRYEEDREYPLYCRRVGSPDADEQVMIDVNEIAEGLAFTAVHGVTLSPAEDVVAWAHDAVGRRKYTIHFKNLDTGEILPDVIPDVTDDLVWAEDGESLLYARQDPDTLRPDRIFRHVLGTDPSEDALVYEESDPEFAVYVWKTRSRAYLMIGSFQTESTEIRMADARDPGGPWTVVTPREDKLEYMVAHHGRHLYIRTNADGATNFKLMRTPVRRTGRDHWTEVLGHRDDVLLEGIDCFADHMVVSERRGGLGRLRVVTYGGADVVEVPADEPAYMIAVGDNPEYDTGVLRYRYSSMTTPWSVYEIDVRTGERTLLKRDRVLGGYDPALYTTRRLTAAAPDGTEIPISLVYRTDLRRDGGNPLLLYGYGSYGYSIDPTFRVDRISLLDRGMAFAIAHVRGGEELGRRWYEDGKLLHKRNTFTDFIACAEHLRDVGIADPDHLYAVGGSAGGLLIGAVINERPDLFHGAIAAVPFVDVVTTMLDDSIPLTTSEYEEWGNPNDETCYEYMMSYSPYDNVAAQEYPHLLVTAGLHDSQVQYWEPAKWVARLRARKTDDHLLLLKTNMDAGHGGASGRFERYRETATEYAFLLMLAGLADGADAAGDAGE